jgi:hypothetical protein
MLLRGLTRVQKSAAERALKTAKPISLDATVSLSKRFCSLRWRDQEGTCQTKFSPNPDQIDKLRKIEKPSIPLKLYVDDFWLGIGVKDQSAGACTSRFGESRFVHGRNRRAVENSDFSFPAWYLVAHCDKHGCFGLSRGGLRDTPGLGTIPLCTYFLQSVVRFFRFMYVVVACRLLGLPAPSAG